MKKVEQKEEPDLGIEAALWGGQDIDQSLGMSSAALEARLAQLDSSKEKEKEREVSGENVTDSGEHHAGRGAKEAGALRRHVALPHPSLWKTRNSSGDPNGRNTSSVEVGDSGPVSTPGSTSGSTSGPTSGKRVGVKRPDLSGGTNQGTSAASHANLESVGIRTKTSPEAVRPERSPDAYSLLREAKPAGVFFQEDRSRDGYNEGDEDPDLAAAVEETIRLLFGVRGILRVGAGKNDKLESIIVVVASYGFSDASLVSVPEKVHRFKTVIAIPFELLPLRRDR